MAATPWAIYNKAKKKLGNGTIQLGVNIFRVQLHKSTSNASVATLSTAASASNEVTNGSGYLTGGKSVLTVTWTTGVSIQQYRFDAADPFWSATGTIASIMYAVLKNSAGQAVAWSKLSTAIFSVTTGNRLTLQLDTNGIFTLL